LLIFLDREFVVAGLLSLLGIAKKLLGAGLLTH
jgi:hypothetical protein